jgi:hypothetical protein
MNRCVTAALLATAVVLAGCEQAKPKPPGVYDLPVAEVYRRLSTNELADMVYSKQCGILIHVLPEGVINQYVTWRVRSSGREVLWFRANLTPISETQTKVDIEIPPDPEGGEVYDGKKFYRRPAFNQPLRPAVQEQISAILEGRKWDVSHVGPGTDTVCNAQRGGLESGRKFRVDDPPGSDGE